MFHLQAMPGRASDALMSKTSQEAFPVMQIVRLICRLMLLQQYHTPEAQSACSVMIGLDKRSVLMFLTRLLTTLAHLYNLVGWLKM